MNPFTKGGRLWNIVYGIASQIDIKTAIDTGAGDGSGLSSAIMEAFDRKMSFGKAYYKFFPIELSASLFSQLSARMINSVLCFPKKGIASAHTDYMTAKDVSDFYFANPSLPDANDIASIQARRLTELAYITNSSAHEDWAEDIIADELSSAPDIAILSGSEFSGAADYAALSGSKYIVLLDSNDIKNKANRTALLAIPLQYKKINEDLLTGKGWSIFQKL